MILQPVALGLILLLILELQDTKTVLSMFPFSSGVDIFFVTQFVFSPVVFLLTIAMMTR